ncbi:MAG: hypothetical protein ABI430_02515 [Candidatus Taylorbacteria bacterium]
MKKILSKIAIIFSVLAVLILILLVIILFLPSVLSLFSKDIDPPDVSDIQVKILAINTENNSYFDLIKIDKNIYIPEDKMLILNYAQGESWNDEVVADLLSKNSEALSYFTDASIRSAYQDMTIDPATFSANTILPPMSSWRTASQLSSIKARYLAKQGKTTEAIEEAFKSLAVGHQIQNSQSPLIEYLVSLALKNLALQTMQSIITDNKLSTAEITKIIPKIDLYLDNGEGLKNAFKLEGMMGSRELDSIAYVSNKTMEEIVNNLTADGAEKDSLGILTVGRNKNYYFKVNKTKQIAAEYVRNQVKNVDETCEVSLRPRNEEKLVTDLSPTSLYFSENAIGKIMHDTVMLGLNGVFEKRCEENFRLSSTKLLFAIKAYKNDRGELPPVLADLTPIYIDSIPKDPYDGEDVRYDINKKIIYSVGKNGKDLGGSDDVDWNKSENPSVKIGF